VPPLIHCDRGKCTGCHLCEAACTDVKEGVFDPSLSRIHVVRIEPLGIAAFSCMLCKDPDCVLSCPRNALRKREVDGTISVDEDKCDGCGWCMEACEYGAIAFDTVRQKVRICDLCEGLEQPRCVEFCPTQALSLTSPNPIPVRKAVRRINIAANCDSCGKCAESCQSKALKMRDGWLVADNPRICSVCEMCVTVCPLKAIRINRRTMQM
jgi:carbon-monoxide dehydrogenase iron sulfur subunit